MQRRPLTSHGVVLRRRLEDKKHPDGLHSISLPTIHYMRNLPFSCGHNDEAWINDRSGKVMGCAHSHGELERLWQFRPTADLESSVCSLRRACMALFVNIRQKRKKEGILYARMGQATGE